jgi:hypothetical protein
MMASLSNAGPFFPKQDRRSFLWLLASIGLTARAVKAEKGSEQVYRFLTPEFEVSMSVQYFANSTAKDFRFRDRLTDRRFCLSANGEENRNCLLRFSGSIAIAFYHFRPRLQVQMPLNLRARVITIDHDSRMDPRPPFERVLAIENEFASDIQAFGYKQGDSEEVTTSATPFALWCLLRQNLYLNDQLAPFLIVHWKHTVNSISLVDLIPGDRTEWINK